MQHAKRRRAAPLQSYAASIVVMSPSYSRAVQPLKDPQRLLPPQLGGMGWSSWSATSAAGWGNSGRSVRR